MPLFRIQYGGRTNENIHDPATFRKGPIPGRRNLFMNVVASHILPQGRQTKQRWQVQWQGRRGAGLNAVAEAQIPPSAFQWVITEKGDIEQIHKELFIIFTTETRFMFMIL